MKKKRIILVGRSCSGKDYAFNLLRGDYIAGLWYTSRPPREGELHGVDYYFNTHLHVDKIQFIITYNKWTYLLSTLVWKNSTLLVGNLQLIYQLKPSQRKESLIVYVNPPSEVIADRLVSRDNGADKALRRFLTDQEEFLGFKDFDIEITDPNFTYETLTEALETFK